MNSIKTTLNIKRSTLVLLYVLCLFTNNNFNSLVFGAEISEVDFVKKTSEVKVLSSTSTDSVEVVSSMHLPPEYEHYSRTKRRLIVITSADLFASIFTLTKMTTGPKVGLFILYSSIKIPC